MFRSTIALLMLSLALSAPAEKFPLKMTAVFTRGHIGDVSKDANYNSGSYRCTKGDEHSAPDCKTPLEWAELDSIAVTPDTVVFTMADGTVVKVQSNTSKKLPGYLVCTIGASLNIPGYQAGIFYCDVYYKLLSMVNATYATTRTEVVSGYTQQVPMSPAEQLQAQEANNKKLFGSGESFTAQIPYRLKGKPDKHTGMQTVELDTALENFLPKITGAYLPASGKPQQ